MITNDGILHETEYFGTLFQNPHWDLDARRNLPLKYTTFCHDSVSHFALSKLNHLRMLQKTDNSKLNAIHNATQQSKWRVPFDTGKHTYSITHC